MNTEIYCKLKKTDIFNENKCVVKGNNNKEDLLEECHKYNDQYNKIFRHTYTILEKNSNVITFREIDAKKIKDRYACKSLFPFLKDKYS